MPFGGREVRLAEIKRHFLLNNLKQYNQTS